VRDERLTSRVDVDASHDLIVKIFVHSGYIYIGSTCFAQILG